MNDPQQWGWGRRRRKQGWQRDRRWRSVSQPATRLCRTRRDQESATQGTLRKMKLLVDAWAGFSHWAVSGHCEAHTSFLFPLYGKSEWRALMSPVFKRGQNTDVLSEGHSQSWKCLSCVRVQKALNCVKKGEISLLTNSLILTWNLILSLFLLYKLILINWS